MPSNRAANKASRRDTIRAVDAVPKRRARLLPELLVVLLPVVITFCFVQSFSVEMPYGDDWGIVIPRLQHLETGHLQWSDINLQHNEALIVFPQAASLLMAKLTRYQLVATIYLSYLFLCGSLFYLYLFFQTLRLPGRWSVMWFLPASALFLGWRQWEGLLWSTHLTNTMALFFALASLYCCTQAHRARTLFGCAILCAWIASFSSSGGLLVWFLGTACFALVPTLETRPARVRRLVQWCLAGGICGFCYFLDHGPHPVPWPTGLSYVLANPGIAARYALIYLGAPLSRTPEDALFVGFTFLLLALIMMYFALARGLKTDGVLPSLLLVAFVGGTIFPLLLNRLGLGAEQAFSSRYTSLSALAPIGVYFCLLAVKDRVPAGKYLMGAMLLVLVTGNINSYSSGFTDGRNDYHRRSDCAQILKDFRRRDPNLLICAYPDPVKVLERAPLLEEYRLSLFR